MWVNNGFMVTAADIRAARARIDETQEQFGSRFGVDRSTVSTWESKGPPSEGTARILIERILADLGQLPTQTAAE